MTDEDKRELFRLMGEELRRETDELKDMMKRLGIQLDKQEKK